MQNISLITRYPLHSMTGVVDFESVVKDDHRPIVQQLSNLDLFKDFKVQAPTIVWSNGVDFAPEFIKSLS